MNYLKTTIGGGVIKRKKNYNTEKHKDCYSYAVKYDMAINLLKEVYPYILIEAKKKRADMILKNYKSLTPRNGRYTTELMEAKMKFYEEFLGIK